MTQHMLSSMEKLVYMANQIARAFEAQGQDEAVAATAEHIASFWDPRMRKMIFDHLAAGGEGLGETALAALQKIMPQAAPAA